MLYLLQVFINYIIGKFKSNAVIPAIFGVGILAYYAGTMQTDFSFDTLAYQNYYNQVNNYFTIGLNNRFEFGFKYLNLLGGIFGLDYQSFRIISFLIFFLIFLLAVQRLSTNISKFVATYSIIPFFSDVTQVRNFFMMTLVLLAYSMLNKKDTLHYVSSVLLILMGASIHSTGYLFLIGLVLFKLDIHQLKKVLLLAIPIEVVFLVVLKIINPNFLIKSVEIVMSKSGRDTVDTVAISSGINFLQFVQYLVLVLLMIWVIYLKSGVSSFLQSKKSLLVLFIVELLTFPLIIFSVGSFSRLVRAGFVTLLIFNASKKESKINNDYSSKIQIDQILFIGVYILGMFTFDGGIIGGSQFAQYIPYILHFKGQ